MADGLASLDHIYSPPRYPNRYRTQLAHRAMLNETAVLQNRKRTGRVAFDRSPRPLGYVGCRRLAAESGEPAYTVHSATTQIRDDAQRREITEAPHEPLATSFSGCANIGTGGSTLRASDFDNHALHASSGGGCTLHKTSCPGTA